jgi:hypothetical protein
VQSENEKNFSKTEAKVEIGLLPGAFRVYDLKTIKTFILGNRKATMPDFGRVNVWERAHGCLLEEFIEP